MDQAKGILAFIQAKHPDKEYDIQGVMSELMRYKLKPDDLSDEMVPTVGTILEISGKSIQTLHRTISLLNCLPRFRWQFPSAVRIKSYSREHSLFPMDISSLPTSITLTV
jgi:hypothetical protein